MGGGGVEEVDRHYVPLRRTQECLVRRVRRRKGDGARRWRVGMQLAPM